MLATVTPTSLHDPENEADRDQLLNDNNADETTSSADEQPTTSLEAFTERLNSARVRAEFEASLITVLTLNVLYMYYVDHNLIILIIRASQVLRLLYLPYASEGAQRSTFLLILLTNIAVVVMHVTMIVQHEEPGRMLFINFIGPEPRSAAKIIFLDVLIVTLETLLFQCRLDPADRVILTMAPVPVAQMETAEEGQ